MFENMKIYNFLGSYMHIYTYTHIYKNVFTLLSSFPFFLKMGDSGYGSLPSPYSSKLYNGSVVSVLGNL